MSIPTNAIISGTLVSTGVVTNISLPSGYNKFELIDLTSIGSSSSATPVMYAFGTSQMTAGQAYYNLKTNGSATLQATTTTSSGGFTFIADSNAQPLLGPNTTVTAISQANPAVVSDTTTTNVTAGSIVRMYSTTGMLQIAGMDFTVGTVTPSTSFTLAYLNSSGFAAAATGGSFNVVQADSRYYPKARFITAITQASSAVITLSVTHGFTVGQQVRILVPSVWGMTQMNNLQGAITAINTTNNTITVNINSTNFTAFAFPTSATAALGISFAQVVPIGEAAINSSTQAFGNLLDDRTQNISFTGVQVGTTVQTSGETYQWIAYKGFGS